MDYLHLNKSEKEQNFNNNNFVLFCLKDILDKKNPKVINFKILISKIL